MSIDDIGIRARYKTYERLVDAEPRDLVSVVTAAAMSVADVPDLLDEVRRLRAELVTADTVIASMRAAIDAEDGAL